MGKSKFLGFVWKWGASICSCFIYYSINSHKPLYNLRGLYLLKLIFIAKMGY